MLKSSARSAIRLRGVRHNNLKNFDLELPLNQLIVITGLSGSGKSSLAFDTLFAEGQRRYIETFSPYARQFFDRMDKPQVDSIEGIPPAIAIEQRNSVRTTRSTVGTMTELCDYMKMLWPNIAQLHCRQCGKPVRKDSPQSIWEGLTKAETGSKAESANNQEVLVSFDVPLTERLSLEESLALISKQGYQRLLLNGEVTRLEDFPSRNTQRAKLPSSLTVLQDRVKLTSSSRPRFIEACEQAYHFGKGKLTIHFLNRESGNSQLSTLNSQRFSNRLHCADCDIEYREPSPALFSFNHPVGACPKCRGFGRVISIDYNLAIPDRSRTLAQGVVKPWLSGMSAECQTDLMRMCRHFEIPMDVPFNKLAKKWQEFVIDGEPGYGKDEEHEWPRAWYGVKGYFRWLESKAYKMHVRVLLSRYRAYTPCPDCHGQRFQGEALLYRVQSPKFKVQSQDPELEQPSGLTLADFYQLPIRDSLGFVDELANRHRFKPNEPLGLVLGEVRARLGYLNDVGLGYLTLDRPTRSLSGGETERVSLTTCLGTRLVNTLFVLDEPSVGLHPRDTERLVRILEQLRSAGNTVVVVEHEASVMRAADQLLDLGPGHGATGGQVVFQGTFPEILKSEESLTGQYLSNRRRIEVPSRRPVRQAESRELVVARQSRAQAVRYSRVRNRARSTTSVLTLEKADLESIAFNEATIPYGQTQETCPVLTLSNATKHNLKELTVEIPLGRFVCITGVSGSGKTTLVREVLLPTLAANLSSQLPDTKASDRLQADQNDESEDEDSSNGSGATLEPAPSTLLSRVVLVDQSILGKTPRSNPAVYIGAFDDIREVFAQSDPAKQRGFNASAFSFNSTQGQCERCRGAGFEKIEMQFLSDVFIRCPDCNGRRYRPHILEVKISPGSTVQSPQSTVKGAKPSKTATNHVSRFTFHISRPLSIADLLDSTIEEAIDFLSGFTESRAAQRATASLKLLSEVGLGYLKLGQPINTLSGGESQRLKLVRHLADASLEAETNSRSLPTLFLFDEPTTGLHFDDVRVLLKVFQRLVDAGHSVLVIEHNLDVIKSADWVIDLGPDAGDQGGQVVGAGTPEEIARMENSHTGKALRAALRVPGKALHV